MEPKWSCRNGSIKCNTVAIATYWSCRNSKAYASNTFMNIITNDNREAFLPSVVNLKTTFCNKKHYFVLDGVNQGSPELIFGNSSRPLSLLKDQQLQIWYGQDWVDCSENGNSGTTYVDIFVWYVWHWLGGYTIRLTFETAATSFNRLYLLSCKWRWFEYSLKLASKRWTKPTLLLPNPWRIMIISNGNKTSCRPIRSIIIRVITKSNDRAAGVRFVYHE